VRKPKFRARDSAWHPYAGILFAGFGMALICLGALDTLSLWIRALAYLAALVLCLGALFLICREPLRNGALEDKPAIEPKSTCLGRFYLNGYCFEAYERETDFGGRRFRLLSYPSVNADQEAAVIRYMLHEGLIETMWPQMSEKIQEEAHWAFFQ
jgi:hypothetical protein